MYGSSNSLVLHLSIQPQLTNEARPLPPAVAIKDPANCALFVRVHTRVLCECVCKVCECVGVRFCAHYSTTPSRIELDR